MLTTPADIQLFLVMQNQKPLFNLLKIILILPIIMFHSFVGIEGWEASSTITNFPIWSMIYNYLGNNFFNAFGLYIITLSYFLMGLNAASKTTGVQSYSQSQLLADPLNKTPTQKTSPQKVTLIFKFLILIICFLGTQFNLTLGLTEEGVFIWDLYSFILLSYLVIHFLKNKFLQNPLKYFYLCLGAFSALPFLSPWMNTYLHDSINQFFFATQLITGANAWFLIPWGFLPLFSYNLGILSFQQKIKSTSIALACLSLISTCLFFFFKIEMYPFIIDMNEFFKSVFWQNSLVNIIRILPFLTLLSLLSLKKMDRINNYPGLKWINSLQWSKNFWFCFMLHFGFIDLIISPEYSFLNNKSTNELSWLFIFIGCEILAQLFFFSLKVHKVVFKYLMKKFSPAET